MKTYKFNGELWYLDERPLWTRIRRWLMCLGTKELKSGRLSKDGEWLPAGFLGHRLNLYGHWFDVRTPWGYLVVVFQRDERGRRTRTIERAFISPNGTPQHAHTWLVGTPPDIVRHVASRAHA